jgi:hypothetical protein
MSSSSRPQSPKVRQFGPKKNNDCEAIKLKKVAPRKTKHKQQYDILEKQ